MNNNFYNDDFEDFLQDQMKNHRMYPNDSVWRGIHQKLHGEKKWPGLTIAAIAIFTTMVLVSIYFTPSPDLFAIQPITQIAENTNKPNNSSNLSNNAAYLNPVNKSQSNAGNLIKHKNSAAPSNPNSYAEKLLAVEPVIENQSQGTNLEFFVSNIKKQERNFPENTEVGLDNSIAEKPFNEKLNSLNPIEIKDEINGVNIDKGLEIVKNEKKVTTPTFDHKKDYNDKNMADDFLSQHKTDIDLFTQNNQDNTQNKFGYTIYFSPTISYRKLSEASNMTKMNMNGPVGVNNFTDVNKIVRHKPGTGLEIGGAITYAISDKIKVKSGVQFNVRQYNIEAYLSNTEIAPIALIRNSGIDTVNTLANYRISNGHLYQELTNRHFQVSMPIGVEWVVFSDQAIQFNIAASVQPTYNLNRDAYLLSTNFKNYTKNPDMLRPWNINTNIEAFVSFKSGDFKWQIGPQFRYQNMPTFIAQYPIKEHLIDYGIKLGVSKTLK